MFQNLPQSDMRIVVAVMVSRAVRVYAVRGRKKMEM